MHDRLTCTVMYSHVHARAFKAGAPDQVLLPQFDGVGGDWLRSTVLTPS